MTLLLHTSRPTSRRFTDVITRTTACCSAISLVSLYVFTRLINPIIAHHIMQDTKAMQSIITDVRDSIFRGYLKSAALV